MLSSFRLAVGRTGQRGPFILSPGTHTAPHPSLCLSQASCPPSWPGGGEGPWRLQLRPHRPSPLPQPGTEQGRAGVAFLSKHPKGVTLLSHWPSQVWREGRREGGTLVHWPHPAWGRLFPVGPPLQPGRLVGCCSTSYPGQSQGLGRWSRELGGAQGRAGPGRMGSERDVGVGCRLGPRVTKLRPGRHSLPLMDEPGAMVLGFPRV